ncbi:unnamed protein product, partial [Iphiclides podalirius]
MSVTLCCEILLTLFILEASASFWHDRRLPSHLYTNASRTRHKRQEEADCSYNEWRCNEGTCVRVNSDCNGRIDCPDGSDETFELCRNRECGPYTFRCNYGGCVDETAPCNNRQECPDESDELLPRCKDENPVEGGKFKCRDGALVPVERRCDGAADCADGSDETVGACAELACPPGRFQCEYGGCVDRGAQCNRTIECADGSDEKIELCGVQTLVRPTTPAPVTEAPKCLSPEPPQNGTYTVIGQADSPDVDYLYLEFACDLGFRLVGEAKVACLNGTWPRLPRCVQTCQLIKHVSIEYECTDDATGKPRDCDPEEIEGAVVRTSCRRPVYYSPVELPYMHCRQGVWSAAPVCTADCGTQSLGSTPLVLLGGYARAGEVPWHVGIYDRYTKPGHVVQICGGSLISNTLVLSAAHCFWNENYRELNEAGQYALAAGKLYRSWDHPKDEPFVQKSNVSEIIVPNSYRGLELYYKNDIAIVVAATPFEYKTYVVPVCLDFDEEFSNEQLRNGLRGKAAGWGLTTGLVGSESPVLKVIDLPFENYESCLNLTTPALARYITYDDKICAGSLDGEALCRGDSGGGLAFPSARSGRRRWYLRGVASTSPPSNDATQCNTRSLTSFTAVGRFERFVKSRWYP